MSEQTEQELLIEKLGISFQDLLNLSPLASRIYALLMLCSYDGLTFEEIRIIIKASKSSISVNINVLTQLNYITYQTKLGDRKRYFKLARYSSINSLNAYHVSIEKEIKILSEVNAFNKRYHPAKFNNEESLGIIYQEYLKEKQQLVKKTADKITRFLENEN
ncbi:transcriptional regulator [uncultured Nonlabens sp.]|uniref:GbsR/MarR family transcriptional regulator n=1 Tax=uncultured Nonlabens sp. TaxID=859306 RepID=UPI002634D673|nr:transcriptional regulator [uncultured Nonlabens sp.]